MGLFNSIQKHFYLPEDINKIEDRAILVIDKRRNYQYDKSEYNMKEFERFIVLEKGE